MRDKRATMLEVVVARRLARSIHVRIVGRSLPLCRRELVGRRQGWERFGGVILGDEGIELPDDAIYSLGDLLANNPSRRVCSECRSRLIRVPPSFWAVRHA